MVFLKKVFPLIIICFLAILTTPSITQAQNQFMLKAQETKTDTQFLAFNDIDIKGKISGDVFALASNLTLSGEIEGNLFLLGSRLYLEKTAKISGSIFAATTQSINLAGILSGNIYVATPDLKISENAVLKNEIMFLSKKAILEGDFAKIARGSSTEVSLNNANFKKSLILNTKYLSYTPKTTIQEKLIYYSPFQALLAEENLAGTPYIGEEKWEKIKTPSFWNNLGIQLTNKLISFSFIIIFGFLWLLLWQEKYKTVILSLREHLWPALGWGIILLLILPTAFLLLLISILGIPLALVIFGFLCLWGYLSTVIVGGLLGIFIMQLLGKDSEKRPYLALFVGILLLFVLYSLPGIGWIFKIFSVALAFGVLVISRKEILGLKF